MLRTASQDRALPRGCLARTFPAMSDVAVTQPAADKLPRSETRIDQLTPRVRRAIELMIWEAKPCNEAAAEVGLTTRAMHLALQKPKVLAYLKAQQQVLRSSEGPASIHRIRTIRDAAENKPALDAALYFLQDDEQQQRQSGVSASPGVTIRIVTINQVAANSDATFSPRMTHANEINVLAADHVNEALPSTPDHPDASGQSLDSVQDATGGKNR